MEKNKWFNYERISDEGKINLICFPYSGGSASCYAPWKNFYPEEINILPVAYPMRELRMKEDMPDSLITLVRDFVDDNEEIFSEPFAFFGHCTGALVAYEAAKYIRKKLKKDPVAFFASSSASPFCAMFDGNITDTSDEIMISHLVEDGIINADFANQDICRKYVLPILRKDLQLHNEYKCETAEQMRCPVIAAYGTQDKLLTENEVNDWEQFTINSYKSYSFNEGHFYLNTFGELLRDIIADAIFQIIQKG